MVLLIFLLSQRHNDDNKCPSILINAGTHGEADGSDAFSKGDIQLLDKKIIL